jgi:uncharacterized protein (DUF1800 family)
MDMPSFAAAEAQHLLRRAAFGPDGRDLAAFAALGVEAAVASLLDFPNRPAPGEPLPEPGPDGRLPLSAAQTWWLNRMVSTAHPLQELMTLFWHNHFATAIAKVGRADLMLRQNELFRRHALGNFRELLLGVTADPAMLIWLDGRSSHKRAPNENYAREMMELFTLGPGHYTEADVHALARALTGYRVDRDGQAVWDPRDHDDSVKTLLGKTGSWGPEPAIDLVLSQPAHGPFLVGKLWEFFVGPQPSAADLAPFVRVYLDSGLELRPVVRALLCSEAFYDPRRRLGLVKSPAELVVSALRALGARPASYGPVLSAMSRMGMDLFDPPNVAGWPGGLSGPVWINAGTLSARLRFAEWLAGAVRPATGDVEAWAARLGLELTSTTRAALDAYRASPGSSGRGLLQLLLSAPEFQLK